MLVTEPDDTAGLAAVFCVRDVGIVSGEQFERHSEFCSSFSKISLFIYALAHPMRVRNHLPWGSFSVNCGKLTCNGLSTSSILTLSGCELTKMTGH